MKELYTIDRIGILRAQIADLQAELKGCEGGLKSLGEGTTEGDYYNGTVSIVETARVNWRAVAEKLSPSPQLIAGNTKRSTTVRLTVTARSAEKVAA